LSTAASELRPAGATGRGRGESLPFEGKTDFPQIGINLFVLGPGEPIGMYHWEADQEDFLVLSGEALKKSLRTPLITTSPSPRSCASGSSELAATGLNYQAVRPSK
jgi:hypothetical protein